MLPPNFQRYVDLAQEKDLADALEKQGRSTSSVLHAIAEEKASFRYAPEKWSVKPVVGHVTDCERVFTYRVMAFARGEKKPLPGFDENPYAELGEFDRLSMRHLADAYEAGRRSTVLLLRGLSDSAWERAGVASDTPLSVRDLARITLGHERHHLRVLREKYGV
jgi:DinB family protein